MTIEGTTGAGELTGTVTASESDLLSLIPAIETGSFALGAQGPAAGSRTSGTFKLALHVIVEMEALR